MQSPSSKEYGIVLLAAGKSSRLGTSKQLLHFDGSTLVRKAAIMALEISDKVIVVIGAESKALKESLHTLPLHFVHNTLFEEGIASSIRMGITALVKTFGQLSGVILIVCDQPYVLAPVLLNLVETAQKTNKGVVASAYSGTLGIPVLFHKNYFDKLLELKGDTGAKNLFNEYPEDVATIDFPLGEVDIDTLEDYEAALKMQNLP